MGEKNKEEEIQYSEVLVKQFFEKYFWVVLTALLLGPLAMASFIPFQVKVWWQPSFAKNPNEFFQLVTPIVYKPGPEPNCCLHPAFSTIA